MIPLPARALDATVALLEKNNVEYAVSGSLAASHHGYVRATVDADVKVVATDAILHAIADRLPARFRRIDEQAWIFEERYTIELYPVRDDLDRKALETRLRVRLFPDLPRDYWVVDLEPLLTLKMREFVRHRDPKHLVDVRELLARNPDTLDVKELERLLALDPAWGKAWDAFVEPA